MTIAANNGQFRIGLLLDGRFTCKSVYDFARWAQAHEGLRITQLILAADKSAAPSIVARFLFGIVTAIERLFLARNTRYRGHRQRYDASSLVASVVQLDPVTGGGVDRVKALDLDLFVSVAGALPGGDIATAARLGAVYLSCGGLAGFWPAYRRDDMTEFVIRHMSAAGEARTLLRGRVGTQFYYLLNQAALGEKAIYYLKTTVEKIATADALPHAIAAVPWSDQSHDFPKAYQTLLYLGRLFWRAGSKIVRKILSIDYRWNVAFVQAGWENAILWRAPVHTIKNPPGRYLADPFVISRNGRRICFVEDYDLAKGRGCISAYELAADGASLAGVALEEFCHLSFPYVFEYQGGLYMCPETSESRDIRIYKCADFPLRWTLEKVVMKDVSAVDTMLFEKAGKWWMLTNIDPAQLGDLQLELRLFSANSPLDERWVPHPQNPIFIDASRARNAGLIREGDRLFRVAQRQGFDFYGKSTSVNEIVRLDENHYAEKHVCDVTPTLEGGVAGTHHLHSDGTVTVFDFVRLARMS